MIEGILGKLVHNMTPTELVEYIKLCATMRSSAQTRRAALVREGQNLGAERKPMKGKKKDSVALAMELLGLIE